MKKAKLVFLFQPSNLLALPEFLYSKEPRLNLFCRFTLDPHILWAPFLLISKYFIVSPYPWSLEPSIQPLILRLDDSRGIHSPKNFIPLKSTFYNSMTHTRQTIHRIWSNNSLKSITCTVKPQSSQTKLISP